MGGCGGGGRDTIGGGGGGVVVAPDPRAYMEARSVAHTSRVPCM